MRTSGADAEIELPQERPILLQAGELGHDRLGAVVMVSIGETLLIALAIQEQRLVRVAQGKALDDLDIDIPVLAAPQRLVEPNPVEDPAPCGEAARATEEIALPEMVRSDLRHVLRPHPARLAHAISADAGVSLTQQPDLFVQLVWKPLVVVVEKGDNLAPGMINSPIARMAW